MGVLPDARRQRKGRWELVRAGSGRVTCRWVAGHTFTHAPTISERFTFMVSVNLRVCRRNWSRCSKRWTTIGIREAHTPASGVRRVDDPSTAARDVKEHETLPLPPAYRISVHADRSIDNLADYLELTLSTLP